MISRRQFLVGAAGAAAGLILPDWLVRAERFIEDEGEPLLEVPSRYRDTLTAVRWDGTEYQLYLGDPDQGPPEFTWVEFADHFHGETDIEKFFRYYLGEDVEWPDPDEPVDDWRVEERWVLQDSPSAQAFDYLDSLDLEPDVGSTRSAGLVEFEEGPMPGSNDRIVTAADELSLSLLQKRLNDLGESVRIVVG